MFTNVNISQLFTNAALVLGLSLVPVLTLGYLATAS